MTNKEHIQRDIVLAFDFVEQILDNPDMTDKIPEGSVVSFINDENTKAERLTSRSQQKKYVKVKRHFEVL